MLPNVAKRRAVRNVKVRSFGPPGPWNPDFAPAHLLGSSDPISTAYPNRSRRALFPRRVRHARVVGWND